ncbi:Grasp-with-spasm system ATP-grasp peptide maturase [Tenacibaculum sp. 190524A02b]|uniref:Grasp-with-spasm system ATP-grasp peptide maturase n=1 Tax=Tenacibaculum vairaonense TaxID=3137860 RepID=A0ABP1FEW3_9FLAO
MIVIFSDQADSSTCDVIDWLIKEKVDFVRINTDENFDIDICINNDTNSAVLYYKGQKIDTDTIKGVWYRRGGYFNLGKQINWQEFSASVTAKRELNSDLWNEKKSISTYLYTLLSDKNSINSFFTSTPNKLWMLKEAANCGLDIPKTIITSSKSVLKEFKEEYGAVITKGIDESIHFGDDEQFYSVYTEEVDIDNVPDTFFPSKFQQKIDKEFEIRTFYFFEKMYSMAIFSQKNENTVTDFRKYDKRKPNRCVPYILPEKVEQSINKLMKKMDLNCGSIDLIYNTNNEYVFLEINPVGQFSMTSIPCNYNLEKVIADKLVYFERNN